MPGHARQPGLRVLDARADVMSPVVAQERFLRRILRHAVAKPPAQPTLQTRRERMKERGRLLVLCGLFVGVIEEKRGGRRQLAVHRLVPGASLGFGRLHSTCPTPGNVHRWLTTTNSTGSMTISISRSGSLPVMVTTI